MNASPDFPTAIVQQFQRVVYIYTELQKKESIALKYCYDSKTQLNENK